MRKFRFLLLALLPLALAACIPGGDEELHQWVAEQRVNTRPGVKPLSEPKQFIPEQYASDGAMDPFDQQKLIRGMRQDTVQTAANTALLTPEMARRKEPLESFPLESMTMVGSLDKKGMPTALLKVDNLIYQVRVGNYLGQNYGKITRITESSIQLREIAQDSGGDWVERTMSLDLQEDKK